MQAQFKIEAVVTCVEYADFLAETLPHNRAIFDRLVVMTAPEDKATKRVCDYWHVKCVPTDVFETRWGRFNKGKAINQGLKELDLDGWAVHMDADILLPPLTRKLLQQAALDPACVFGIDRFMVPCFEEWRDFMAQPALQQEGWSADDYGAFIHPTRFRIGVRVAGPDGYLPIGFFQMWNPKGSGVRTYPEQHTSAGRGDMLFAMQWPRAKRGLIPEIIGYHLESEPSAMGSNWNGRKTKPFRMGEE